MLMPLAAACPTSDDLARRLDIPICAVPSMIAAMPVVDPSAAMSKVVPGCEALNCSASCGTSFAPRVSEPLMTSLSARTSVATQARARRARRRVSFMMVRSANWVCWLELNIQVGLEDLVFVQRVDPDIADAASAEGFVGAVAVAVAQVESDSVGNGIPALHHNSLHIHAA